MATKGVKLQEAMDPVFEWEAEQIIDEIFVPSSLKTREDAKKTFKNNLWNDFKKSSMKIIEGVELIAKHGLIRKEVLEGLSEVVKDEDLFNKMANSQTENLSVQDSFGFTDEDLMDIQNFAADLYSKGKFQESSNIYRFLCLLNAKWPMFWNGFAFSEGKLENHLEAYFAFMTCVVLDRNNLKPILNAVGCLVKLNLINDAKDLIEKTLGDLQKEDSEGSNEEIIDDLKGLAEMLEDPSFSS